ncbi:MAG: hypothetical protein IJJ14_02070, partial [Coriobacteriales bacterium]|nr:hypothetical protein [Coriobacteriales bacterium]
MHVETDVDTMIHDQGPPLYRDGLGNISVQGGLDLFWFENYIPSSRLTVLAAYPVIGGPWFGHVPQVRLPHTRATVSRLSGSAQRLRD